MESLERPERQDDLVYLSSIFFHLLLWTTHQKKFIRPQNLQNNGQIRNTVIIIMWIDQSNNFILSIDRAQIFVIVARILPNLFLGTFAYNSQGLDGE